LLTCCIIAGDEAAESTSGRSSLSDNNSPGVNSPCDSPLPQSSVSLATAAGDAGVTRTGTAASRYFVIKPANAKVLQICEQKGIWATTPAIEKKLAAAFSVSGVHIEFLHCSALYCKIHLNKLVSNSRFVFICSSVVSYSLFELERIGGLYAED
jgi:YT521-B-like domain